MTEPATVKKSSSQIKSEIDLLSYMVRDGVKIDPQSRRGGSNRKITWCICPVHGGGNEHTGSLAVYDDQHWFCYGGCQRGGDLFSYVMWRNDLTQREFDKVVSIVTGEAARTPFVPPKPVEQKERKIYIPTMDEVEGLRSGFSLVEKYVQSRSIPSKLSEIRMLGGRRIQKAFVDSTGQRFPIEYNQVALPYLFNNVPYSINFRRDDLSCIEWIAVLNARYGLDFMEYVKIDYAEKRGLSVSEVSDRKAMDYAFGPRFYRPSGTRASAYGVDWFVRRDGERLVYNKLPYGIVAEGEFDELSGSAIQFPTLANKIGPDGKSANVNLPSLLRGVTQVFVAVDDNEAGEKYAQGTFKALGSNRSWVRFFRFPKAHNDMNKMLQANLLYEFMTGSPLYLEPMPYLV